MQNITVFVTVLSDFVENDPSLNIGGISPLHWKQISVDQATFEPYIAAEFDDVKKARKWFAILMDDSSKEFFEENSSLNPELASLL